MMLLETARPFILERLAETLDALYSERNAYRSAVQNFHFARDRRYLYRIAPKYTMATEAWRQLERRPDFQSSWEFAHAMKDQWYSHMIQLLLARTPLTASMRRRFQASVYKNIPAEQPLDYNSTAFIEGLHKFRSVDGYHSAPVAGCGHN